VLFMGAFHYIDDKLGLLRQIHRVLEPRGRLAIDDTGILHAGEVGDDLLHDAHHPTARGHATLAQAVLRALLERGALGRPAGHSEPVTIDLADCLSHFGVDSKVWDGVCAYTATFYRDLANLRFDPSERKAKQRAYEAVRPKIAAGAPLEQLGVPGMGLVPPGSLPVKWWEKTTRPAGRLDDDRIGAESR